MMTQEKITIKDILKDGVTIADVLKNLKEREKQFQHPVSFVEQGNRIRRLFPEIYQMRMKNAENCLEGLTILPGSPHLHFIGNPVKWHENIYDYDEYTYQLNRMDHWRTMAEAYSFTGDIRYGKKIVEEFYHWIKDCPCQPLYDRQGNLAIADFDGCKCNQGIWRSLEVGIRMYRTWPYIIHHLLGSGLIDETFLETYLLSAYQHGQILYLITPKLWPKADHNHYLMENNGLLYLSCMFPELKEAETWKKHALHEMERSIFAQITDDGGQIEGCASYHNGCAYWFVLPLLLSQKYGFTVSEGYQERLKKMVIYSAHATRPCGGNCSWGDSHTYSGTFCAGAFCYYLAYGDGSYLENALCYYSMTDLMNAASQYIWEVPDLEDFHSCLTQIGSSRKSPDLPLISWQKELKQVFFRTDWSTDALYVMFACRTPVQNQHAHIDPAGFEFSAFGRTLLGDPSIYYYKNDENRKNLKSAHWHNCLTLNHKNPWKYISSWEYGKQEIGDILNACQTKRLIYSVGYHMNYRPTIHKRAVAIVDSRFLAVMDCLDHANPEDSVQINFHMDTPQAMANSQTSCAQSLSGQTEIAIFADQRLKPHLVPAKISTKNDVWHDTMIARFEAPHVMDSCCAFLSLAFPLRTGMKPPVVANIESQIQDFNQIRFCFTADKINYSLILSGSDLTVESHEEKA